MYNVAVAGATGAVGRQMLKILAERDFPIDNLVALASPRSRGKKLPYRDRELEVEVLAERSFEDIDLALFSAGSGVVAEEAPRIMEEGAVIVDNSSAFRYQPEIPLVVPEVNPAALEEHDGLISNPNCSTIQMVMALAPLHREFGLKRVVVSTYQAASGAGGEARQELFDQTKAVVEGEEMPPPEQFSRPLAFNSIPEIGEILPDEHNYTKEEMKMVWETQKILEDESIEVSPTAIRIPVLNCHGETINLETEKECPPAQARRLLDEFEGVEVVDDIENSDFPTMLMADGQDETYVGRIRRDFSVENGLNCWIVADNLRKGAALNTIQIAEELHNRDLI